MVEGLQLVSTLITQYDTVERTYLRKGLAQQDQLEKGIIQLYVAILNFLCLACRFYAHGTAGESATRVRPTGV